ncbi:hypothetical protein FRC10_007067 [Ceratobasidium sp. 414]|nr:hypothetical protein FRC10_007067 [Ceratobasidium sp. 414]
MLIDIFSYPNNDPDWEKLKAMVYELALRYMLVADKYQREATLRVVDTNKIVDTWTETPKHADAQDSRLIMTAFIHTLSGDNKGILLTRDPYIMLRLVALATDADTQDLLPEVVDAMHGSDLLDLTAHVILRLKPAKSSSDVGSVVHFFNGLAKAVPESELERRFGEYVPNWWKFNQHLAVTEYGIPATPSASHQEHYDLCMEVLNQLSTNLLA